MDHAASPHSVLMPSMRLCPLPDPAYRCPMINAHHSFVIIATMSSTIGALSERACTLTRCDKRTDSTVCHCAHHKMPLTNSSISDNSHLEMVLCMQVPMGQRVKGTPIGGNSSKPLRYSRMALQRS